MKKKNISTKSELCQRNERRSVGNVVMMVRSKNSAKPSPLCELQYVVLSQRGRDGEDWMAHKPLGPLDCGGLSFTSGSKKWQEVAAARRGRNKHDSAKENGSGKKWQEAAGTGVVKFHWWREAIFVKSLKQHPGLLFRSV